MSKKVIVSVINDLVSDQRVHRTCQTLTENGYSVLLVGRQTSKSNALTKRDYDTHRMKLIFEKGALFYAEFNLRLFLFLLFKSYHFLHSNDLDTLLANYVVKKIKGGKLIYDSHEYFCEVPELVNRPRTRKIWQSIESYIFPKLKHVVTVNKSIADIYTNKYKVKVGIIRNVPIRKTIPTSSISTKSELGLPEGKKIILLQGAGINVDRGAEEMVEAMQYIDAVFLIVGTGDVIVKLKKRVSALGLSGKIIFTGRVPFDELLQYTNVADVGVTLDKDTNLNYKYSLPNKIFDYIHADLPVIASDLVEVKNIIEKYNVGCVLSSHEPKQMAEEINNFLNDKESFAAAQRNVVQAKQELNWDLEKEVLTNMYLEVEK